MRCPSPPAEPELDDQQLLRQQGFQNAPESKERCLLRPVKSAEVPRWLFGMHYRLAPAVFEVPYMTSRRKGWFGSELEIQWKARPFQHLFDAIPMLQRFEFGPDGNVMYSARILGRRVLDAWQAAHGEAPKNGKEMVQVTQTSLGWKHGRRFAADFPLPRPSNAIIGSNIVPSFPMGPYRGQEGRLVLHQSGLPIVQEVDMNSAMAKECFGYGALNGAFVGTPCARPLLDPTTGEMINVLADYGDEKFITYRVVSIPSDEPREDFEAKESVGRIVAKFKAPPTIIHSFILTPNFVVIPIYPLLLDWKDQPSIFKDGGFIDGLLDRLRFDVQQDTLFYVVSRRQMCLLAVYRSEACFAFNTVNGWESADGNQIIFDICAYENDHILAALQMPILMDGRYHLPTPNIRRYTIGAVREEAAKFYGAAGQLPSFPTAAYHQLGSREGLEFPVVHPAQIGSQAQFIWGLGLRRQDQERPGTFWTSIVKVDPLYPHDRREWSEPGCFPSPPVLIPRPGDLREDQGIIMTTVLDTMRKRSFLLLLEAETMKEVARFWLPVMVSPSYLPGCWVPLGLEAEQLVPTDL